MASEGVYMRVRMCTGCRIANAHRSRPKSFRSLGSPLIPDTDAVLSSLNWIIRAFNKGGEGVIPLLVLNFVNDFEKRLLV